MKAELRKSLIKKRMALSDDQVSLKSQTIFKRLLAENILENHKRIMVYKDFRKEVQTDELIDYLLEHHYEVILPRVSEDFKTLELYHIKGNEDMQLSSYGILEPIPLEENRVLAKTLDLILSPGVGFTPNCYRIGYGGGFYDKLLSGLDNIMVCALAFDCQLLDALPLETHDQQLDMIVTETRTYKKQV
jgi:5-formyltetrahydrofolate cyclo-ligase